LGAVFDLVNFIPIPGLPGISVTEDRANNDLRDVNIDTFALEVPTSCLVKSDERGVIGAWTGVRRLHHDKDAHVPGKQISRLGNPLVNELLIGIRDKGFFNNLEPQYDIGFTDEYINYPSFPELLNILFLAAVNSLGNNLATLAPTNLPRDDLYAIFMTGLATINKPVNGVPAEMMRLNTTIPATPAASQSQFGVIGGDAAGYPNGRRPGDDVVDITLRAAMGRLCHLPLGYCDPEDANVGLVDFTDGAPIDSSDFTNFFPYARPPMPGSRGL
jgi:hypothetical protein